MLGYKKFLESIIYESLHPDLQAIVGSKSKLYGTNKKTSLVKKIKELTRSGQKTGIEGNMPAGSSRAYLKHEEEHHTTIDGKPASFPTGTKVAIRAQLDKHHDHGEHDGKSLGHMQNEAENGDWYVNGAHRVLTHDHETGQYHTNEDGIFPPLVEHDHDHHEWSHVGHCNKITRSEFKKLTKTKSHPQGISHGDFSNALERFHNRNNGAHWGTHNEEHLNHIEQHPLVQRFMDYHGNTGNPPHDLRQIGNMGTWTHPHTGQKHIVARDSGFSSDVQKAYTDARKKQMENFREKNRR